MQCPYSINSKLNFGKYSSQTIADIWSGNSKLSKENVIRQYLQEFLDLFNGVDKPKKKFVGAENSNDDCQDSIKYLEQRGVFLNVVVAKKHLIICEQNEEYLFHLRKFVHWILSGSYQMMSKSLINPGDDVKFSQSSLQLMRVHADPSYISWAIKTIETFYIIPDELDLLESKKSTQFLGFKLIDICEDVIEYKYLFKEFNYKLMDDVRDINTRKFNSWISNKEIMTDFDQDVVHRSDYERDSFDALTDGQFGDYEDWKENSGDLSDLRDDIGY